MSVLLGEEGRRAGGPAAELPAPARDGARLDTRLMARVLAGLFAAGATLATLTVALPHPRAASELGLLSIVAGAYAVAALLLARAGRLSPAALAVGLAWGSASITGVAYFSGQNPSPLIFFYLWVFLYSAYFFSTSTVVAEIALVGALYGGLLALRRPPSGAIAWWLVGIGTLTVAAVLVGIMRERSERLIARLYDASRTDPLTSLPNRRAFRETLDLELARTRRTGARMAVIVADVDRFGEINDRCGAQVGDAALRRIAQSLARSKRDGDALARVGGDEFALVVPDTNEHSAYALAERLRRAVAEELAGDTVPATISVGIAQHPAHGETAAALLRATDAALSAARRSGGDRAVLHSAALATATDGADARDVAAERLLAAMLDLAEAVDLRFSGSARHSETVGRYAEMVARELGLPDERVQRVRLAGLLHDIGKVAVPDAILQKPGKLSDEELQTIRRHPQLGEQMLDDPSLADVSAWVGAHHERPDGGGYPRGLQGEQIPLEARIVAIADSYEAMTSDRSYRDAIGSAAACAELQRCAGTQFDGDVVRALLAVLRRERERAGASLATV